MDYEKEYKEALKIANAAHKDEDRHLKATLERIFPELKESEDERIRKWLIAQLQIKIGNNATLNNMIYKAIDWLEKQGNSNSQNWKPSKEQINALEHFVRSIAESDYASPYDTNTKLLYSLLKQLKKL